MRVILANPRGFCAGVDRAIGVVERALELFGAPIYVRHEVVHNQYVVGQLRDLGAIFVDDLHEVPDGTIVIFSAHGVSQAIRREADRRGLRVFDATCPLVTKVHLEVIRHAQDERECILIGHAGHPEVEGTLGQYQEDGAGKIYLIENESDATTLQIDHPGNLAFVTQTTLSIDDASRIIATLRQRFPNIIGPKKDDICYATQSRQDAVKKLSETCDVVLVVGSKNSSNSNRLRELAERHGIPAHLLDGPDELKTAWFINKSVIGITAGASAPEILVQGIAQKLASDYSAQIEEWQGENEEIVFPLPKELQP